MPEDFNNEMRNKEKQNSLLQKCETAFPDTLTLWDRVVRETFDVNPARHSIHNVDLDNPLSKSKQADLAKELGIPAQNTFYSRFRAAKSCVRLLNERDEAQWLRQNAKTLIDSIEKDLSKTNQNSIKIEKIGSGIVNLSAQKIDPFDLSHPINHPHTKSEYRQDIKSQIIAPSLNSKQQAIYNEVELRPHLKAEIKPYPATGDQHPALPDYWLVASRKTNH